MYSTSNSFSLAAAVSTTSVQNCTPELGFVLVPRPKWSLAELNLVPRNHQTQTGVGAEDTDPLPVVSSEDVSLLCRLAAIELSHHHQHADKMNVIIKDINSILRCAKAMQHKPPSSSSTGNSHNDITRRHHEFEISLRFVSGVVPLESVAEDNPGFVTGADNTDTGHLSMQRMRENSPRKFSQHFVAPPSVV